jgi:hypothetical protein
LHRYIYASLNEYTIVFRSIVDYLNLLTIRHHLICLPCYNKYIMRLSIFRDNRFTIAVFAVILLVTLVAGCSAPAAAPAATSQPLYTNPKLGVSPMTVSLQFTEGQSATVTKKITIANEGEGVMVWAARKTVPWMWMTEADGALEKGYSKTLEVFIAPSGLTAGTYTDNISIEGIGTRNSPLQIAVTMLIKPPAAAVAGTDNSELRKPVPAPPWDYSEFKDDTYHFRIRYPKDYSERQIVGWSFGAQSNIKQQSDTILLSISSSYGADTRSIAVELTKSGIRAAGGTPRADPKVISSDNATTLADGVTRAYEMVNEIKTAPTQSYQCYLFGTQKGSRYIFFVASAPLPYATERMDTWKQIAHTLEFLD